jgi:hypothetical protein
VSVVLSIFISAGALPGREGVILMNHKYIGSEDSGVSCLTCGGYWSLAGNGKASGAYAQSLDGSWPTDCTGNTSEGHHYADECPADECSLTGECNCLRCHS